MKSILSVRLEVRILKILNLCVGKSVGGKSRNDSGFWHKIPRQILIVKNRPHKKIYRYSNRRVWPTEFSLTISYLYIRFRYNKNNLVLDLQEYFHSALNANDNLFFVVVKHLNLLQWWNERFSFWILHYHQTVFAQRSIFARYKSNFHFMGGLIMRLSYLSVTIYHNNFCTIGVVQLWLQTFCW